MSTLYVSGQKIDLDAQAVWVLSGGAPRRVEHWSAMPSNPSLCLVTPLDSPPPGPQDFASPPPGAFAGVSSLSASHGRRGRQTAGDAASGASSAEQVFSDYAERARTARSGFSGDAATAFRVRRAALAVRPMLDMRHLSETPSATYSTFARVPLEMVLSRGSGDSWDYEFDTRQGRLADVANTLLEGTPESADRVFHVSSAGGRIRTRAFDGPSGPVYVIDDGSHRTAGAMLAGLDSVYADVERVTYPTRVDAPRQRVEDLLAAGLVTGEFISDGGREYFQASSALVPWIFASPESVAEISRHYERVYPGGLDSLPVPPQTLTDAQALRAYLQEHPSPSDAVRSHVEPPAPCPVSPGSVESRPGLPSARVSLLEAPRSSRLEGKAQAVKSMTTERDRQGFLFALEDKTQPGLGRIRSTFGVVGEYEDMVPPGWKAEWVLDHALGSPYGSNMRVIVFDPEKYTFDPYFDVEGPVAFSTPHFRLVARN